jgi:hypothetical protein
MATTTRSRSKSDTKRQEENSERSAFNWSNSGNGALLGAVAAGAALGIAANFGRKFLVQATSASTGDWVDALTAEHAATLALFDKLETTDDSQTTQRTALLKKIKYALSKHAIQEEMVVYPALRQANFASDADHLGEEHGYIKTYIYELRTCRRTARNGWPGSAISAPCSKATCARRRMRFSRPSASACRMRRMRRSRP